MSPVPVEGFHLPRGPHLLTRAVFIFIPVVFSHMAALLSLALGRSFEVHVCRHQCVSQLTSHTQVSRVSRGSVVAGTSPLKAALA